MFIAVTAAVAARGGAPFAVDASLHERLLHGRSSWLTAAALTITATGSGWPAYGLAAAAGIAAGTRGRLLGGATYVLALLAGQGVRLLLVMAVHRPRPPVSDWAGSASGAAFPSGHATTSALVAALICWTGWRRLTGARRGVVTALALAWAVAVGLTRVYLGVHWPTDVAGGWLLAIALVGVAVPVGIICGNWWGGRQG
jgi:undecaprenyl-diphosphatase